MLPLFMFICHPPPPTMSFWMEFSPKIYITKYAYISRALAPLVSTLAA